MPEAVFTAEAEPESLLDVEEGATCWMTTLPPVLPTRAPTKPPTKPMAAASTSATALRAILPFFRRRFLGGCLGLPCAA